MAEPHSPLTTRLIADGLKPRRRATGPDSRGRFAYGKWWIVFDAPPIPVRTCDFHYWHDDFDGAPDSRDSRYGHCASLEDCLREIDDIEAEERAA